MVELPAERLSDPAMWVNPAHVVSVAQTVFRSADPDRTEVELAVVTIAGTAVRLFDARRSAVIIEALTGQAQVTS